MKGNIEIGHLSKFDAVRSNRDQVMGPVVQKPINANLRLKIKVVLRPKKKNLYFLWISKLC